MMRITIAIDLDNEVFQPDPTIELARILHEFARRLECGIGTPVNGHKLQDENGNTVGVVSILK